MVSFNSAQFIAHTSQITHLTSIALNSSSHGPTDDRRQTKLRILQRKHPGCVDTYLRAEKDDYSNRSIVLALKLRFYVNCNAICSRILLSLSKFDVCENDPTTPAPTPEKEPVSVPTPVEKRFSIFEHFYMMSFDSEIGAIRIPVVYLFPKLN